MPLIVLKLYLNNIFHCAESFFLRDRRSDVFKRREYMKMLCYRELKVIKNDVQVV